MWVLLHAGYLQSEAPVACMQRTEHLVLRSAAIIGPLVTASKKVDLGASATVNLWAGTHQAMAYGKMSTDWTFYHGQPPTTTTLPSPRQLLSEAPSSRFVATEQLVNPGCLTDEWTEARLSHRI